MGDQTAHIKINFNFHDKDYKLEAFMNYQGYDRVDSRIVKFFEDAWADGHSRWLREVDEYHSKVEEHEIEENEREELARLKKKYE